MQTVCIDCRYLDGRPSGIGECVAALIEHLPGLAPDLDLLLLRSPGHEGPLSHAANVREQTLAAAANGPATMWWLPRAVDLSGVNLFHAPANIMPAGLAMPCLTTIHDLLWLTRPDWCRTGLRGRIDRHFYGHGIRRALAHAAAIATVSRATAADIARYAPATTERVRAIPSGVAARFRPAPPDEQALRALEIDPKRRFVLTVGQSAPYKNHEGALRGFAEAFGDDSSIDLLFVQRQGVGAARLLRHAAALGIAGRVRILPVIDEAALRLLYGAAQALLHPSLHEGFGNPVAEAMACGCPVVTSACSAMPEVAGDAARLVDPHRPEAIAAGLREVVCDRDVAARLRARGLARAQALSWRNNAAGYLALYRELLARPRR